MFVFGGNINARDLAGSIEILNLLTRFAWSMLIEYDETVRRNSAAVAAISANKIIVFGGLVNRKFTYDGYLLDIGKKQLKPILGKADDLKL